MYYLVFEAHITPGEDNQHVRQEPYAQPVLVLVAHAPKHTITGLAQTLTYIHIIESYTQSVL